MLWVAKTFSYSGGYRGPWDSPLQLQPTERCHDCPACGSCEDLVAEKPVTATRLARPCPTGKLAAAENADWSFTSTTGSVSA